MTASATANRQPAEARAGAQTSDFGLLSELQRIVDLDAEVARRRAAAPAPCRRTSCGC